LHKYEQVLQFIVSALFTTVSLISYIIDHSNIRFWWWWWWS